MTVTLPSLIAFHCQHADETQRALDRERNPAARAKLQHKLNWHRSAVRMLDRQAEELDRRTKLARTR